MNKSFLLVAPIALLTFGCRHSAAPPAAAPDVLQANLDTAVNPGDDFFTYANGGWLQRNPIPASESSWGIGNAVQEDLYAKMKAISETAATSHAAPGTDQQKIGDFWAMANDTATADRLGATPLKPQLDAIAAIQTPQAALDACFALQPMGVGCFFSFGVEQDEKQSSVMSVHLGQGGLGLPNRDFYFNPDAGIAHNRAAYLTHITNTMKLLGDNDADAARAAGNVMGFETSLAQASRKLAEMRDPQRNYNKMTPAVLTAKYSPSINWEQRLAAWGLHPEQVIVGQPEFFTALNSQLAKTPVPALRDYLRFHLAVAYAPYLSQAIESENFSFYHTELHGQKEPRPRWKRSIDAENRAMGMVLGHIFVDAYFPPGAKQRYTNLVEAIRTAYRARIAKLDWMSDATKAKALAKLNAVTPKVGYPDKWKDYSALNVARNSYAENMMNANRWRFNDMVGKFGKPVDRTEWDMTPQTYNAYYNPSNNEIVLPAAQFAVPGIPDAQLDDAIVYGYSGASTIGHEITHGFDDEGRQFDAAGNLAEWWTKQDETKFNQRAAVMVKQFNAYEPLPGLHINGAAALGENIADYGGVLLGLDAFEQTEEYKQGKPVAGLTPLQRFFLGYALGWLDQTRQANLRSQLLSDVHAPAKWRVLGPMSNIPEFYQAFGVKPGQAMYREPGARVNIW